MKNNIVREFYAQQGFEKILEDEEGKTIWLYRFDKTYKGKNKYIEVKGLK